MMMMMMMRTVDAPEFRQKRKVDEVVDGADDDGRQ